MCPIPRMRRWPGGLAGPGGHGRPLQPRGSLDPWAGENLGTVLCAVAGPLSFWRIVPSSFAAWVAVLEGWQLTAHDGQLRLGRSVLRGPADHDQHFGTCRIEVRLARELLRPRVRAWRPASTGPCPRPPCPGDHAWPGHPGRRTRVGHKPTQSRKQQQETIGGLELMHSGG